MVGGERVHSGDKSIWMLDGVIFTILTDMKDTIRTELATWLDTILNELATSLEDELLTQVLSLLSCSVLSSPPASTQASVALPEPKGDSPLSPWIFPAICFDLPDLPNLSAALVIWVKSIIHGCAVRSLEGSMFP